MRLFSICLAGMSGLFFTAAHADVFTFETPSENIQCDVGLGGGGSDIHCTIIVINGPSPFPKPGNCTSDWGHDFYMNNRGPVSVGCQPLNTNKDGWDKAEYGVTGEFGGFTCHSATTGLRCSNEDGHGFFLSRAVQNVF